MRPLSLLVFGFLLSGVSAQRPDRPLDASAQGLSTRPQLAQGDGGFVACVYDGSGEVRFTASRDGGVTWGPSQRVDHSVGATAWNARVAVFGPFVYVVWEDVRDGEADVYCNVSADHGATWLPVDRRVDTDTPGAAESTDLRVAAFGPLVFVAWRDERDDSSIRVNVSVDAGMTFGAVDRRLNPGLAGWSPQVALSTSGVGYVAWVSRDDVWLSVSSDAGVSWSPQPVRVNTDTSGVRRREPSLAVAGSSVFVAWTDGRRQGGFHRDVYVHASHDQGATWSATDTRVDTGPLGLGASQNPVLVAAGPSVYAAWQEDFAICFNVSHDAGATWLQAAVPISSNPPPHQRIALPPTLAAHGDSVFTVWHDGVDSIRVNYSFDRGATWLPAEREINRSAGIPDPLVLPRIAVSEASAVAVWSDRRDGGVGVYTTTALDTAPYGEPTVGAGPGVPALDVAGGMPRSGATLTLHARGGIAGATGAMLVGIGAHTRVEYALLGGVIHVLPNVPVAARSLDAAGEDVMSLPLPTSPAFVGVNVNFQALWIDAGAPGGVAMTNALSLWIG